MRLILTVLILTVLPALAVFLFIVWFSGGNLPSAAVLVVVFFAMAIWLLWTEPDLWD